MREIGPSVLSYLRAMLRDDADAADALSGFAESLLTGLATFRGQASLRTWAMRLAVNEAFDLRSAPWRRRVRRLASREASALADQVRASSEQRLEQRRQQVNRLRRELPPEDQSLLVMRLDQGLSWAEIGEVLAESGRSVNPAALSKRFERIRARLARMARRDGLVE